MRCVRPFLPGYVCRACPGVRLSRLDGSQRGCAARAERATWTLPAHATKWGVAMPDDPIIEGLDDLLGGGVVSDDTAGDGPDQLADDGAASDPVATGGIDAAPATGGQSVPLDHLDLELETAPPPPGPDPGPATDFDFGAGANESAFDATAALDVNLRASTSFDQPAEFIDELGIEPTEVVIPPPEAPLEPTEVPIEGEGATPPDPAEGID